ncbi:hypothetical protein [Aeromonas hydrophila]|uniref:hypothetical protein n=1 Tax=Aeromonas hydrophila TaxID=644 RepID=UPI002B4962CF|nr:hypothetical protein [Aeromonas hydrophila]
MAGVVYLSDREWEAIMEIWNQTLTSVHGSDDAEFNRSVDELGEVIEGLRRKYHNASLMTEARRLAKQMTKT